MREQFIQTKCIKHLESAGAYVVKVISATRTGVPDILVCMKGKFMAFEFKQDAGEPSPLQEYNIRRIREAGGKSYLVRSLDELKIILKNEGCYE